MDEAPTSQKKVPRGEAQKRSGIPTTNRPVYRDFWVIVLSPNWRGSAPGKTVAASVFAGYVQHHSTHQTC